MPQVRLQPYLLLFIQRHAFVVVIGQAAQHEQRLLGDRQNAVLLAGHAHSRRGVGVQYTTGIMAHLMHRAMDGETRRVDFIGRVHDLVALQVDLDQIGGGHFLEHQPIGVDQEVLGTGNLGRHVGEDHVIPAMHRDQAVAGGQIHPGLPFLGTHQGSYIGCGQRLHCIHGNDPLVCRDLPGADFSANCGILPLCRGGNPGR